MTISDPMNDDWQKKISTCPICHHPWDDHPENYWEGCKHAVAERIDDGISNNSICGCPGEF